MRYFKYKNVNKNINNAYKEQYLTLTKDEKRTVRKEKIWSTFSCVVSFFIFVACFFASIYLLKIIPLPSNTALKIFVISGKVIAGFILLFGSGLVTYLITRPMWKKADSFNIPLMRKEFFSKACKHLRDYYKLQEPYVITKCYASTDENFKNHDVCIFVADDELRITADLIQGFLHGERDLGCHAFKRDEIVVSKKEENNLMIAELKAGDTVFSLGYRAKSFIEKNFIEIERQA